MVSCTPDASLTVIVPLYVCMYVQPLPPPNPSSQVEKAEADLRELRTRGQTLASEMTRLTRAQVGGGGGVPLPLLTSSTAALHAPQ
jgi:hypothetical protein